MAPKPLHASGINDYDIAAVRADFPILSREVYGRPLVYLDSAASAQKPRQVIDAVSHLYENDYSNVHRGLHFLSGVATDAYEAAREKVRALINARSDKEIVFTRNATEAINLVAASYGRAFLGEGAEVVISAMEHHANIVPWQLLRDDVSTHLNEESVEMRGAGLMLGMGLQGDCSQLVGQALESGLLMNVTAGNTLRLLPPLVISESETEQLAAGVTQLIKRR